MEGDEGGALGEATGHEEPSAGCCGEFLGGNGALEVVLCMGHPGLGLSARFSSLLKPCLERAYWRSDI